MLSVMARGTGSIFKLSLEVNTTFHEHEDRLSVLMEPDNKKVAEFYKVELVGWWLEKKPN